MALSKVANKEKCLNIAANSAQCHLFSAVLLIVVVPSYAHKKFYNLDKRGQCYYKIMAVIYKFL